MDYELGIVIDAAGNADLDEDKIAKAQKKVLKNLTNNSGYYSQKLIPQTEGESEYEVEVNAKSIEDLKKKQGKIIREHGEEYDRVADVNADSSPLEEDIDYDRDEMERKGFDLYPGGRLEAWRYATEDLGISADEILGKLSDDTVYDAIYHSMRVMGMLGDNELDEHGQYADRVADVNADSSPLEEEDIEELGKTRDSIYEKYAKKYGVDVNELKDRIEAIKLEKEAIEVGDEDTAIAVQKKSPEADVRIVKK
jgi:hypothetical protein